MLDDCFARENLPGIFDKKAKQIEHERLDVNVASVRSQTKLICVEVELIEAVSHEINYSRRRRRTSAWEAGAYPLLLPQQSPTVLRAIPKSHSSTARTD
jgi:hypothetical protein